MKILQISTGQAKIPAEGTGGPERYVFLVSKELAKMGHEVTILDRKYSSTDPSLERIDGVNVVRLSVKQFAPSALEMGDKYLSRRIRLIRIVLNSTLFDFKVNKYIKRLGKFDAINSRTVFDTFLFVILNKGLRDKVFLINPGAFWTSQYRGMLHKLLLPVGSFTMKRAKGVIVENDLTKSDFITRLRIPEEKVVVVPPGTDINLFSFATRADDVKAKYRLNGKKVVLFVGRVNKDKGLEHLVGAANILLNQYHYENALFLLVGPFESVDINKPGAYTAKIFNLIKSFKLEQNVRLAGTVPLDELRRLYLACDIFVLPSITEQFAIVVIEAMASGKPVVATKTPGALMQVRDGWNGFLVEIGNERELAEKIKYLLDNPEEAKRMGNNAREFAKEFDLSKVAQKYVEVYTS